MISFKLPDMALVVSVLIILESNGFLELEISTRYWYKVTHMNTSRLSIIRQGVVYICE